MATVAHALPDLSNDNFLTVASLLGRDDLATALRVSEAWNAVLEGSEHLWASMCQRVWASKSYIPPSLRAMAGGQTAMEEAGAEERLQLTALKISQLKDKMRSLSCRVRVADLLEKKDFVDVIVDAQRQATANGTVAEKWDSRGCLCATASLPRRPRCDCQSRTRRHERHHRSGADGFFVVSPAAEGRAAGSGGGYGSVVARQGLRVGQVPRRWAGLSNLANRPGNWYGDGPVRTDGEWDARSLVSQRGGQNTKHVRPFITHAQFPWLRASRRCFLTRPVSYSRACLQMGSVGKFRGAGAWCTCYSIANAGKGPTR
jgi:hypothetical protein